MVVLNALEDVELIVQFARVDFVEDLQPHKRVEHHRHVLCGHAAAFVPPGALIEVRRAQRHNAIKLDTTRV